MPGRHPADDPSAQPHVTFEPDAGVAADAPKFAADFVAWAQRTFNVSLDFSDDSVRLVEQIAVTIDNSIQPEAGPQIAREFGIAFGFYIGEVYRRTHGMTWGWAAVEGARMPGIRTDTGLVWWPVNKATRRLLGNSADDLAYYYHMMCEPPRGEKRLIKAIGPSAAVTGWASTKSTEITIDGYEAGEYL